MEEELTTLPLGHPMELFGKVSQYVRGIIFIFVMKLILIAG
jgi:hypothetical protein